MGDTDKIVFCGMTEEELMRSQWEEDMWREIDREEREREETPDA